MIQFRHYSPRSGLTVLDPRYFGTAKAGAERRRASVPSVCLYHPDGIVESIFNGCTLYHVPIDESLLYDLSSDLAGLLDKYPAFASVERAIKRRGFLGYWLPAASNPLFRGQARIFGKVVCYEVH